MSSSVVRASDEGLFRSVGTIRYSRGIETIDRYYFVVLDNGTSYDLAVYNFPQAFQVDGLRISFSATVWMEMANQTDMHGRIVIIFNTTQLLGDVNLDSSVDIYDAIMLAGAFNTNSKSSHWNANTDFNGDGVVDIFDAILLASNFGTQLS